jgi:hypothetical protein
MTTLDLDVADVGTAARPAARSADTKAALIYLREGGASPICIVECDGVCKFTMGKVDKNPVETWWIAEVDARGVVTLARKIAGRAPDVAKAEAALIEAAREKRATLTPNSVALDRARAMSQRLDAYLEQLRARGALKHFMKEYRRRILTAQLRGEGFMSFGHASLRLRRTVGAYLSGGRDIQTATLFADVFGS